jgi:hypothetical protein
MAASRQVCGACETENGVLVQYISDINVQMISESANLSNVPEGSIILHNLQQDLVKLSHMLKTVQRESGKEVIHNEIDFIRAKIISLKDQQNDVDSVVKWTDVISRRKRPTQLALNKTHHIPFLSNRYQL